MLVWECPIGRKALNFVTSLLMPVFCAAFQNLFSWTTTAAVYRFPFVLTATTIFSPRGSRQQSF